MLISCVILALAAGVYALWPLFGNIVDESAGSAAETDTAYLTARKTAIYRNIKELEFEYKKERLSETDFLRLDAEYKGEAAEVLHKLDMLTATAIKPEPDNKADACPACGTETIPGKKFCADCGARLQGYTPNGHKL